MFDSSHLRIASETIHSWTLTKKQQHPFGPPSEKCQTFKGRGSFFGDLHLNWCKNKANKGLKDISFDFFPVFLVIFLAFKITKENWCLSYYVNKKPYCLALSNSELPNYFSNKMKESLM